MSDDEIISQDDIDKLLNASVNDENDGENAAEADIPSASGDEFAELSQEDIDNLLSGGPLGSDSSVDEADELDTLDDVDNSDNIAKSGTDLDSDSDLNGINDLDLISQDDIDKLMNSADADTGHQSSDSEQAIDLALDDDDDDDDLNFISQEDISKLVKGSSLSDDKIVRTSTSEPMEQDVEINSEDDSEEESDELDLVSQDDIDKLLNDLSTDSDGDMQPEEDNAGDSGENFNEVGSDDVEESVISSDEPEISSQEQVLDESDAFDIEDCFIDQDTIDRLFDEDSAELESASDNGVEESDNVAIDLETEVDEKDASEDLDTLLEDSPDEPEALDEDAGEVSDLISQDDIDELLKGTDEEEEDILGDIDGKEDLGDQGFGDDIDLEDVETDQVVIEEADESDESSDSGEFIDEIYNADGKNEKDKLKKRWYKSKLILAGLGTFIILLSIGSGYYFFFYRHHSGIKSNKENMALNSLSGKNQAGNINDANFPTFPQVQVHHGPGTIAMNGFIVLSPVDNKKITYIKADISVHYLKGQALDEIKKHLPFYRSVIYDAVRKVLQPGNEKKVTKENLSEIIRNALNQVMSEKYIDQVFFTSFKTG